MTSKLILTVALGLLASGQSLADSAPRALAGPVVGRVYCTEDKHIGSFAWNIDNPDIMSIEGDNVQMRFPYIYQMCTYNNALKQFMWVNALYPYETRLVVSHFPKKTKQKRLAPFPVWSVKVDAGYVLDFASGEIPFKDLLTEEQIAQFNAGARIEKVVFLQMALPRKTRVQDTPSEDPKNYWLSWGTKRLHVIFDKKFSNGVAKFWYSENL